MQFNSVQFNALFPPIMKILNKLFTTCKEHVSSNCHYFIAKSVSKCVFVWSNNTDLKQSILYASKDIKRAHLTLNFGFRYSVLIIETCPWFHSLLGIIIHYFTERYNTQFDVYPMRR